MRDLQPLKLELLELTKFRSVLADYYAATNLMLLLELKFNMHDPMPTEISLGNVAITFAGMFNYPRDCT